VTPVAGVDLRARELTAARSAQDSEAAFERLVAPYRLELRAHCYRMLGSVHDADDALQDALLRAWRGLGGFEARSSLRAWLYTITTNACLRTIERRPQRVLPIDYSPPGDPHEELDARLSEQLWIEPYPDAELPPATPEARYEQRESIELAFIAALQNLPARQRAVLILRDVLGFSAREVAETLDTSPPSVDSLLQRAHVAVRERLPAQSQQATLRALGDQKLSALVDGYVDAWERGDVDAVVAMLTEDARIAMPPVPTWYEGRDAVATFLRTRVLHGGRPLRLIPVSANSAPAFAQYAWEAARGKFVAHAVTVLTIRGEQIAGLMAFLHDDVVVPFGLAAELTP
jgi:RNA polymerase sigma-70 factor, ECF subfamily